MGRSLTGFYYAPNVWIPVLFVFLLVASYFGLACLFETDYTSTFQVYISVYHMGGALLVDWLLCLVHSTAPSLLLVLIGVSLLGSWLRIIPGFAAGVPLRPPKRPRQRSTRSRSSGLRYHRYRRRHLHYCLVQRCQRRVSIESLLGPRIRQHRRWRRRRDRKRLIYKVKRRQFRLNAFLQPLPNSYALWNSKRVVDSEFVDTEKTIFLPHANHGYVPEEALHEFCSTRGDTFLAATRLIKKFDQVSLEDQAQRTVQRYNVFQINNSANNGQGCKCRKTPKTCPLVWDTGASFGLTPFRSDFIDYTECSIQVNDIARSNTVIGLGTTLHKFHINGDDIFLPCLSYHLPTAEVRLFSPQTYHTLYGGHSAVGGDKVDMYIDMHKIEIPIDRESSNVPMVHDCHVTSKEMKDHGPYIRSALPKYNRMVDSLGAWSHQNYKQWKMATVPLDPEMEIAQEFDRYAGSFGLPNVGTHDNKNLSGAQKELLLWHWKLGISMQRIQELMRVVEVQEPSGAVSTMDRVIKPKIKSASNCPIPLCQSCQLSRAKQRKPKISKSKAIPETEGVLSKDQYEAGDFVSVDQYVIKAPGRLPTGYGRESDTNMFHGGTIFRDAATKYIHVQNQVSLGAGETVNAKVSFESWLWEEARVAIKHYHGDNGIFTADLFKEACAEENQTQSFSGVGAQHQNAEAERAIQTIMYMARSFMIHAALNWGDHGSDDLSLWSFAVDHSAWLYNRIPQRQSGITPMEMITKCKTDHSDLLRTHVWGCPVYVLEAKLQDGKKLPKWNRRARMGQFLGFSRQHSSTVAMVRNLHTGYVSPQYHVVFDDKFETVFHDGKSDDELRKICDDLFANNRDCFVEEEYDEDGVLIYTPPPLDEVWLSEPERRERRRSLDKQRVRTERRERELMESRDRQQRRNSRPPDLIESDVESDSDDDSLPFEDTGYESGGDDIGMDTDWVDDRDRFWIDHPTASEEAGRRNERTPGRTPRRVRFDDEAGPSPTTSINPNAQTPISSPEEAIEDSGLGRSADGKSRRLKQQYGCSLGEKQIPPPVVRALHQRRISRKRSEYRKRKEKKRKAADALMLSAEIEVPTVESLMACPISKFIHFAANDCGYKGSRYDLICNWVHPLFLKAKSEASKEDNPSWKQAMSGPFKEEYWKAALKEIETLESMDVWEVVDRTDDMNVINSIWAFKLKRFPDGMVKKFKARFCARGDQQLEGVDFFETYAPVVQWTTVRLMLILEILLQLKSKQGDVTAAFVHGKLEDHEKVHIEMPLGFRQKGKVLKLKKTLYGLRQSPRAFWKYLTDAMNAVGLETSKMDPCLFVGEKVTAVAFVDDILFWSSDEAYINELGVKLREQGLLLEQEDDAAGYLGVNMSKTDEGFLEMKQTGLIDRILEALGLDSKMAKNKYTPAESTPLTRDEDGEGPQGSFSYASVVGMLLYLAGHTRPDIAYAVNCCARYMFNPRLSHENALKRIGRYLKATRDKGLILNPSGELKIDAYPDADFAGLYGHEKNNDPACAKSRTGFVITVADCPMVWVSKLQTETALSTMEAEIIALAHCCRELFPVMDIVKEMGDVLNLPTKDMSTMHVSIHEDNAGALVLAETIPPQFTPRSKYYAIKTVWFREEINKRGIKLLKIDTEEQLGDIFTKGLPRATFEYLREKMMLW